MTGFGGVLSIELRGDFDAAARTIERLELFQLSASLGSVESLAVHPASMWRRRAHRRASWSRPASSPASSASPVAWRTPPI